MYMNALIMNSLLCMVYANDISSHEKFPDFAKDIKKYHWPVYPNDNLYIHFNQYLENLEFIEKNNFNFETSLNKFGFMNDITFSYVTSKGCYNDDNNLSFYKSPIGTSCIAYSFKNIDLPNSIDWRNHNAVTSVKNQGQCGSCWSFSATGAMEGAWAISQGTLISLSEQQLLDCSRKYGDMACNGGLMDSAFNYAIDNGMCSEEEDPYEAELSSCMNCIPVAKFSQCVDVTPNNQVHLKEAVANGPVSVAIEADQRIFQFYSGGVIDEYSCGTNLDHGVLIVGYGSEDGKDYWLVKNSWGDDWGENGYVKIARSNSTNDSGICGIAMQPSYIMV